MEERPRPTTMAYRQVAIVAPIPAANPGRTPWEAVFLIQMTPAGPMGAAIARPMMMDCKNKMNMPVV